MQRWTGPGKKCTPACHLCRGSESFGHYNNFASAAHMLCRLEDSDFGFRSGGFHVWENFGDMVFVMMLKSFLGVDILCGRDWNKKGVRIMTCHHPRHFQDMFVKKRKWILCYHWIICYFMLCLLYVWITYHARVWTRRSSCLHSANQRIHVYIYIYISTYGNCNAHGKCSSLHAPVQDRQ